MTNGGNVPSPISLLLIQAGGGLLALLPIATLRQFARLTDWLYWMLVASASANVVIALILLFGFMGGFRYFSVTVGRVGQLGLCRALIFYDTVLLGMLVFCTGGAQTSAFGPQFAAVLPMAMLIKDEPSIKWAYAGAFLLMFLVGFQSFPAFHGYLEPSGSKDIWFLVFFFIFTLFPVIYSIQSER